MRLALTVALTFVLVGAVGYQLMSRQLQVQLLANDAAGERADARSLEIAARGADSTAAAYKAVAPLIDAFARRPGVIEALLIDSDFQIVGAHSSTFVASRDRDPRIDQALSEGRAYAGKESDPLHDARAFEFVTPLKLAGASYAYETTRDHRFLDHQVDALRRAMGLVGLLALLGGSLGFYLLGGRTLSRDHERALQRATHDGLTDLGNHRAFQDALVRAAGSVSRHGEPLSLLVVDLDDFKFSNDRHGHSHGDELLVRIAEVLKSGRTGDFAFRVGGDEFVLILPRTGVEGAEIAARRLHAECAAKSIRVSIGLSTLQPGQDSSVLREEADAALYEAKRRGGDTVVLFDEIAEATSITTPAKVRALRQLLVEGDLEPAFQPIWRLRDGSLLGVEALARPGAQYGFEGPAEAFDVAERIGRIHELDRLCVDRILAHAPELPADALLFLNLAPQTLDRAEKDEEWLVTAVTRSGLTPEQVVIEVTERFSDRIPSVVKRLLQLRDRGFRLALDDLGRGNSGLDILRQVAFDYVKIDRSVVQGAVTDSGPRGVLLAIATFARQTGATVIAEGIEDDAMLQYVQTLAIQAPRSRTAIQGGQGFGLGRPAPTMPATANDAIVAQLREARLAS